MNLERPLELEREPKEEPPLGRHVTHLGKFRSWNTLSELPDRRELCKVQIKLIEPSQISEPNLFGETEVGIRQLIRHPQRSHGAPHRSYEQQQHANGPHLVSIWRSGRLSVK